MTSANCRNGEAAIIQPRADRRFSPRNTVADAEIHGLKDEVPSFQMLHFRSNKDRIFRIPRLFFFANLLFQKCMHPSPQTGADAGTMSKGGGELEGNGGAAMVSRRRTACGSGRD